MCNPGRGNRPGMSSPGCVSSSPRCIAAGTANDEAVPRELYPCRIDRRESTMVV